MATLTITNPLSLLLLQIIDRLKTKVPGLLLIAKDIGQLEVREQPAIDQMGTCLISFRGFGMDEMGGKAEEGVGDVIIKIARGTTDIISNLNADQVNKDALEHGELAQQAYLALHCWGMGEPFGKLSRRGIDEDLRRPGLMVAIQTYRVALEDYSAVTDLRTIPAGINLSVEIEIPD